ncbi:MAG: Rsd/AlgQ family anti-sigma factor [Gammaproteobacteria bacterium]|nr:MAG: Rsd/AlgQ family anti-sigma factor [Gammaproteobacteria bacterium]
MYTKSIDSLVEYSGKDPAIDRWLMHRQWVLAGFYELSKKVNHAQVDASQVRYWCQELMDYLSAGHFRIFADLHSAGSETRSRYTHLVNTTDRLVVLQESLLTSGDDVTVIKQLLSEIGETLATQLEVEDELIRSKITTNA